jgi:hypothetical protein
LETPTPTAQRGTHGARFVTFDDGAPNRAGYFKNVAGQTVGTFTILQD